MKIKRITSLMLLIALAWLVPKTATAAEYTIGAPVQVWANEFTGSVIPDGANARQLALAPDGKMFVLSNTAIYSGTIMGTYRINVDGTATIVNTGMDSQGLASAFDDAGNYIYHGAYENNQTVSAVATSYRAKTYSQTATGNTGVFNGGKALDVSSCNTITYYCDATGDVYSGTGYLWFAPNQASGKITVVTVSSGAVTGTLKFETGLSAGGNDGYVQVYDTSDATATKLLLFLRGVGMYDVSVNMNTQTVNSCVNIPAGSGQANYNSLGAHIFMLRDHKILVRNTRSYGSTGAEKNRCPEFEVLDITDINNPVSIAVVNPFPTKASTGTYAQIGSWVQSLKVSDNQVDIFAYCPGLGAARYSITATEVPSYTTAPLTSLSYTYSVKESEQPGRQDVTLNWEAPTGYTGTTITGYKIYRGSNLIKTADATATSYTITNLTSNYTFTVVPIYDGVAEDSSLGKSVTTTEVTLIPIAPVINYVGVFDGFNNVQVYWEVPSYGKTPTYYNVYRDGVKISVRPVVSYAHIDLEVVEGNHYYEVESVYTDDNTVEGNVIATKMSDKWDFSVGARNMTYTKYAVEEIYNYPIPQVGETATSNMINNTLCPDFYDLENYRQGAYYDGYWYIIQRSSNAKYDSNGAVAFNEDVANGSVSYILRVSATDPRTGWERLATLEVNSTVGIAIDEAGNIFVRENNLTALGATKPSDATAGTPAEGNGWFYDHYDRRITTGLIIKRNSDGSYDTANPIIVDLKGLAVQDMLPDNDYDESYESTRGRADYYSMTGDVTSAEGGYLYLAYTESNYATRVKIVNGAYVSHEHVEVVSYKNWTNETVTLNPTGSLENYVIPIDGRDDYVALFRSQAYVQLLNEHFAGTTTEEILPIQEVRSRVNTAGGTTIEFNNDLFMISPQAKYSRNLGDFIVMRASKTDVKDVNTANLNMTIPVWQFNQADISDAEVTNANGNWIFAEEGTWTIDGVEQPCVYIYQYVPGIRIAKYRLYPLTQFPYPPITLDVKTGYEVDTEDTPIDIVRFDGHVTWSKPAEYNYVEDQSTYRLASYHLEILDNTGAVIDQVDVDHVEGTNDYSYDYAGTELLAEDINYTARIYARYVDIDGKEYISDKNNAVDKNAYVAAPPVPENVSAYVHEFTYTQTYRVELNFAKPTDTDEPVSFYNVYAVTPDNQTIQITDFNLMVDGVENENIDADGVAHLWDIIPGTYDFDANEAAWHAGIAGEESGHVSTLVWYHTVDKGAYTNGAAAAARSVATDYDPSKWTYYIVANYASTNAKLVKSDYATISTNDLLPTGIEVVSAEVSDALNVYPNPAQDVVNITAASPIEAVALFNEAGAQVLSAEGNGETLMQVNVEGLASGVYFIRVNNLPLVKLIKK